MTEYQNLVRTRGALKARVTNFKNYLESLENDLIPDDIRPQFETLYSRFKTLINAFDETQNAIEMLATDDVLDAQYQERANFESTYFQLVNRARLLLNKKPTELNSNARSNVSLQSDTSESAKEKPQESSDNDNRIKVQLPQLKLEKFDGKSENFTSFSDQFKSLIHNNKKLDDTARFIYLKSFLSEDPLKVIQSIELTA